jgi:uncharacterized protein (TIGR00730 family)
MHKPETNVPAAMLPPKPRREDGDFRTTPQWRALRVLAEFVDGWNFLPEVKQSVTIFGSARFKEDNHWYQDARKLGKLLTDNGYSVVTGGGPGIMEAGNRGASEGGKTGDSIGLNIKLPFEERANPYVEKGVSFHYFFVRKVMLAYSAQAYVYYPGGWGTLDELSEIVTLVQTKKITAAIPMVLVGREFWTPFLAWMKDTVCDKFGGISPEDMGLVHLVDTAEEAFDIIHASPIRTQFG